MTELAVPLVVALAALAAGTLAAVAGFGGAAIMLPVLVWAFGVRDAVPLLTVAQLIGNASRVWFNRRELALPVVGWFALGAVPLAVVGGVVFATAPAPFLRRVLGAFLLFTVAYRHTSVGRETRVSLRGFAGVGAVFAFLSALLGSVGPLMAPFFLTYGLVKGAYIGTEAFATVTMHVVKIAVYSGYALMGWDTMVLGLTIGSVLIVGSYLGKKILDRMPARFFPPLIETVLVIAGAQFLILG
ncbi:MAG: sulfite exporter TauE/SafE family protein [Chloroflexi bacterium]|nr:sulfite exporter TauE/SafE family protein [Chloroflexota bacterium]